MALIRPILVAAKQMKSGKNKLRLAISHNGATRYITTDIVLDAPEQFNSGMIVKHPDANYLNTKLRRLIQNYQEALDEIPYQNCMTCSQLIEAVRTGGAKKHMSLEAIYNEYISLADISEGTIRTYGIAFATLSKCISPKSIVENYTPATILELDKKLRKMRLSPATIRNYMTTLSLLIRYAVRSGYVSYKIDPFVNYTPPRKVIRDAWLSPEEIKAIRDVDTESASIRLCRDFFMLSYYLGGINLVDLLKIDFSKCKGKIKYARQKVSRKVPTKVEFDIPEEAAEIISKYKGRNGTLDAKIGRFSVNHDFCVHHMSKLAEAAGIERRVVFYSARKSFAQHALDLGAKECVIDYILGHSLGSSGKMLYHYVYVTPKMASNVVRQVLDNLK